MSVISVGGAPDTHRPRYLEQTQTRCIHTKIQRRNAVEMVPIQRQCSEQSKSAVMDRPPKETRIKKITLADENIISTKYHGRQIQCTRHVYGILNLHVVGRNRSTSLDASSDIMHARDAESSMNVEILDDFQRLSIAEIEHPEVSQQLSFENALWT